MKSRTLKPVEERFMKYVSPEPMSGCWLWTGSVSPKGYGKLRFNGRTQTAHRASIQLFNGVVLRSGDHVLHSCDLPGCVSPHHLRVGTNAENTRDKMRRGRHHASRITHCPQGHEYTPENTYTNSGRRQCVACSKANSAKRFAQATPEQREAKRTAFREWWHTKRKAGQS